MIVRGKISLYDGAVATYTKELKEYNTQLTQINDLMKQKDEVDKQAETIKKITRRLPSSPDAPGFLNALLMTLGTTGIIQENVKPGQTTDRTLYTEIPYSVVAHGHYHAFGQFLTLIEQNPDRFMRVKKLKIENNLDRPSVHPIEMEIATFMFNQ
jgi:Tfp pilus assembly protein PilO